MSAVRYDYFPLPEESSVASASSASSSSSGNGGADLDDNARSYRLKRYANGAARLGSVYAELRSLRINGYTHVANMPGNFHEILYYARRFRLVVLDRRLNKLIADLAVDYFT